ncbi:MAG: hypothetical protein KA354_15960 [Phycisphaerae bacterium]|nr:hypothetical protein [Phycisphaerae bacterium]
MAEELDPTEQATSTIVGIDEAGYGPLLGPLVVSAAAFDVPVTLMRTLKDRAAGPDLWDLLQASLTARHRKRDPRLAVSDSKKLHGKSDTPAGIALLERAALTFLMQHGKAPVSLRAMIQLVCPHVVAMLGRYPWYAAEDIALPVEVTEDDLGVQRSSVQRDLAAAGIRFRGAWVEVLPEGDYNDMVGRTRNKAVVLFALATRLMQRIANIVGPRPLRIWVDRQGGRVGYARPLMTAFQDAELEIVEESPERSSYRLNHRPAPWMIRFVQKGETHHMQIALASIFSKYVRELLMMCFNRYWARQVPDLKPTAGYYEDGRRFLADAEQAIRRLGIDRSLLVRAM